MLACVAQTIEWAGDTQAIRKKNEQRIIKDKARMSSQNRRARNWKLEKIYRNISRDNTNNIFKGNKE